MSNLYYNIKAALHGALPNATVIDAGIVIEGAEGVLVEANPKDSDGTHLVIHQSEEGDWLVDEFSLDDFTCEVEGFETPLEAVVYTVKRYHELTLTI